MLEIYDRLFGEFSRSGIRYSLFKGLDHVEEDLLGERGDVDLWVAGSDLKAAIGIALETGFFRVTWSYPGAVAFVMIGWDLSTGRKVMIHLHRAPIAIKKRSLAPFVLVYQVPPIEVDDSVPARATEGWRRQYDADRKVVGSATTMGLALKIVFHRKALRALHFRFSLRETARTYVSYVHRFVILRGRFRIARGGLLVAFTGIDGSGKSSIVADLGDSDFLKTVAGVKLSYFGNNSFWIPGLSRAVKKYRKSTMLGAVVMGLAVVDRKLRIIPALIARAKGKVVLCDRYFYDQNIGDPTQNYFRNRFLKSIVNPFVSWIPVLPDASFYLQLDPRTAHARKPDHAIDETTRAAEAYDAALLVRGEVSVIDAGRDIESVLTAVRSGIIECFKKIG